MEELIKLFVEANGTDSLLDAIYEQALISEDNRRLIPEALIELHNAQKLDVISAFHKLVNKSGRRDFFMTRHVLEAVLPKIQADLLGVMTCVIHLTAEAGQDMAAGILFRPYIEFCFNNVSRPMEAILLIENNVAELADLLSPSLVAGARHDEKVFVEKAVKLTVSADIELRKRAIFALGKIQYLPASTLPADAIHAIESAVSTETDDQLLAASLRAAFDIFQQNKSLEPQVVSIISKALAKGADNTLYAASEVIGFYAELIPAGVEKILLEYLLNVNSEHKGTLDNIDYGLHKLLAREDPATGVAFIEQLLTTSNGKINLDVLDSCKSELYKNRNGLLDRLTTRWLSAGNPFLCRALAKIIKNRDEKGAQLKIDPSELGETDLKHLLFIARKAIGFLFFNPVTATGLILSLLPFAKDEETRAALAEHIFDPLLINYPGQVRSYLESLDSESENANILAAAKQAIQKFDSYLEDLKPTKNLKEHLPSLDNREAYRKHFAREMAASMKEAEKQSVFLSIIHKSVLLYGRKSISYVQSQNAPTNRMEIPLQSFSTSIEVPRLQNIDPLGLEYFLRVFKYEEIRQ